jgi:hypothetical protein
MAAVPDKSPTVSPRQAHQMFEEADAALVRCTRLVPPNWLNHLKNIQSMCASVRDTIRHHLRSSPSRWLSAINQQRLPERRRHAEAALQQETEVPVCDSCSHPSVGLKVCTSCRAAKYCSRACQVAAWPSHKTACKAARRAAAGS